MSPPARGHRIHHRMVVAIQQPMQPVPITTKVVSLNSTHGKM